MEPVDIDPRDGGDPRRSSRGCRAAASRVPTSDLRCCLEGRFGIRAVAPTAACIADPGRGPRIILLCGLVVAAPVSTGVAAALVSTRSATSKATGITGVTATEAALATAG